MASSQAVRASVASADNYNALARGKNLIRNDVSCSAFVLLRQKLHREINSFEFSPRNVQVTRIFSASGQQDGVKFLTKILRGNITADVSTRLELNALRHHLLEPPVQNFFLQFEIRNAIAEQTADSVRFFKYGDRVPGAI